jgi:hypothetical protein
MDYMLHLYASETLYEEGGPLYGSDQPESMKLGPYPDYIELTYKFLRVGPDGDHLAAFDAKREVWVVGVDIEQRGIITVMKGHDPNGTVWSDITITIKE